MRYVEALTKETGITYGRIYKVINYDSQRNIISIINNFGELRNFRMADGKDKRFEDITIRVRNTRINNILE